MTAQKRIAHSVGALKGERTKNVYHHHNTAKMRGNQAINKKGDDIS